MHRGIAVLACLAGLSCGGERRDLPRTEPVVVPSLLDRSLSAAVDAVEAAGLRADVVTEPSGAPAAVGRCPGERVRSSDPAAGTAMVRGSSVTLVVGRCG